MIDEESTDDELGVNLQLAQRLQINMQPERRGMKHPKKGTKEFKQFFNERKKGMHDDDDGQMNTVNLSSPEFPVRGGWFVPETPSPYHLGNKKRQNGDRGSGRGAKSKRTCLSDEYLEDFVGDKETEHHIGCLPLASVKKANSGAVERSACNKKKMSNPRTQKYFKNFASNQECSSKDISPDETYENHLASKMPLYERGKLNIGDTRNNKKEFNKCKKKDYATPINESLSLPSTSKVEHVNLAAFSGQNRSKPVHRGVQFIDSDSDDENLCFKRGALKGGKETNFGLYRSRKGGRKILDTDDSDDSNWILNFRNRSNSFSPSDSNGSNEGMKPLHLNGSSTSAYGNNQCSSAEQSKQSSASNSTDSLTSLARNISFSRAGSNSSECETKYCDDTDFATATKRSLKLYKQNKKKLPLHEKRSTRSVQQSHEASSQSTSRDNIRMAPITRCASLRRRSLRCKNNRTDVPSASPSSWGKVSSDEQSDMKLTARFPDVFDAEDGLEFFTANSYSSSDSSNGLSAAWGIGTKGSNVRKNGNSTALDYANIGDSSENEISVIFSTNSHLEENNRTPFRGSVRNRRSASGHEHNSDIVSLSPDPVEQVRQMEEDERLARYLQAQFDAEVNRTEEPNAQANHSQASSDDSEVIDPPQRLSCIHQTLNAHLVQMDMPQQNHNASYPSRHFTRGRRRGGSRRGSRHLTHVPPDMFNIGTLQGVGLLDVPDDPWTWQFARMLGLGPNFTSLDSDMDDYELLLEIAEDIGEVVPRGLHKAEVNRLPTRKYTSPNSNRDTSSVMDEVPHIRTDLNKECQVCLCDYEHGDILRILPCFHEFHIPCIDPWLKINRTCPVCRVVVNFGE